MKPQDKPWSTASPDVAWDAIVIGSGMGGMTTAAILSTLGRRVLVLEQHYIPGGFTHAFKRRGYRWDVGVHAVGEVTARSFTGRLLRTLTGDKLEWASLGGSYESFEFPGGLRIDFPDNPRAFRDGLVAAFPKEERAIDDYLALIRDAAVAMKPYLLARPLPPIADRFIARRAQRYLTMTTAEALATLTSNEELKSVLTAQWAYYGATPSRSSFAVHALVARHFVWGGYYPVGGAPRIARSMLETVAGAGGWTRISADVESVIIEDGKATGVVLTGGEIIRAKTIVSAAGAGTTVRRLIPEPHRSAPWAREIAALGAAPAHVCLYLGFEGDIQKAGAGSANQWFYETWSTEVDAWDVSPERPVHRDAPVLYCSFPSLKDPSHDPGPKQRHTGEVVTFVPWSAFTRWKDTRWKKRGAEYEAFKAELETNLLEQFLAHRPALRPLLRHVELSTPLSTDKFARPLRGSIYGLAPTPARFLCKWLRPRTPIKRLYLSGSDVSTVGVMGAMMGGVLSALAIEPVGTLRLLNAAGMFR